MGGGDDPYILKLYVKIQDKGFSSEQNSSKRKKEKKKIEKTDTNEGLLQRFREYMKDHNEKKEVIKFVNLINWEYLQKKGASNKKRGGRNYCFCPLFYEKFVSPFGRGLYKRMGRCTLYRPTFC